MALMLLAGCSQPAAPVEPGQSSSSNSQGQRGTADRPTRSGNGPLAPRSQSSHGPSTGRENSPNGEPKVRLVEETRHQQTVRAPRPTGRDSDKPEDLYAKPAVRDPQGIGKLYMGRPIAKVMGYRGAKWLERPSREDEEKTSLLPQLLEVEPGMSVADIGAGTGVVTVLLARAVGPKGEVYAVDIQEEMLKLLRQKLRRKKIKNVKLVKGTAKSPNLTPNSLDLVVLVDVYHEFAFPYEMMREITKALKSGGRLALVEYRKEDPEVPIKRLHKMSEAQVKKEMSHPEFGLQWQETIDKLPRQHVVVFKKR